jgi:magnesium transporter
MSVVAAFAYKDGKQVRAVSMNAPDTLRVVDNEFVWIGLLDPDEAELATVQRAYDLHPLAVEDSLKPDQLPKAEVYGDQLFVLARTAYLHESTICYGQTAFFLGRHHIVSVRQGSARAHTDLREHLEAAPSLLKHGVDYVLHAVLDFIVDGYFPIVEGIEEEVHAMERRALDAFLSRHEVTRIFNLRRELTRFERILGPMEEMANRLEHRNLPCIDPNVRPYFRDVADHVRRVAATVGGLRDVLSIVFEASTLLEQQRQGAITRQLAAWAAILAVPTAIAGIYGMNFDFMPELRWRYGYFVVVTIILVICMYLYWRFKRSGWL